MFADVHADRHAGRRGIGAATGGSGDDADRHGDECLQRGVVHLGIEARQMTAGDMAGFVRHDADDLVGPVGAHQRAGVHEQILAAGDEGVERRIVDDIDMHRLGIEAGDDEDWRRISADGVLDLGVADDVG